jgi:hypothetical protein
MDTELDVLFDELNTRFFDGRLPKYRVRWCAPHGREHGFIDEAAATICICDPPDVRVTLLHEMCHIGTAGHGRVFRAKLRRLARQGERWAQAERAYYLRAELGMSSGNWLALWEVARQFKIGATRACDC